MDTTLREVRASDLEALGLATELLQRARRAHPEAGLWEAADVQWRWCRPRESDDVEQLFWLDGEGPVAGVLLTSMSDDSWQCDPVVVPGATGVDRSVVWSRAVHFAAERAPQGFEVPVGDDDHTFRELAERSGLEPGERDSTAWLNAAHRPVVSLPPGEFVLVDRIQRHDVAHPMRHRNGPGVARRLEQCSLYDPALDLAVEAEDGREAGYALFWFDPVTGIGLVEPVRVEEEFQRHGLARAMLSVGIERLVARGARRVKVAYAAEAAAALYGGLGFSPTSTTTWYTLARRR